MPPIMVSAWAGVIAGGPAAGDVGFGGLVGRGVAANAALSVDPGEAHGGQGGPPPWPFG